MGRHLLCLAVAGLLPALVAAEEPRHGLFFGAAAGPAVIQMHGPSSDAGWSGSASFPNFKLGWMLSDRLGVALYLPGTIYRYEGTGRPRDRGFEAAMASVQAWASTRWWVLAGAGLGLDAPAFYDVKSPDEGKYYPGLGAALGTGYEVWRRRSFALDLQARVHVGRNALPEGIARGRALDLLVGVNWY
jgi:hypothetical protein